jgi:hypothetical protein
MLSSLIIKAAAGGTLALGGVLLAMESGWIGGDVEAQPVYQDHDERTFTSSSRPGSVDAPDLPLLEDSDVILPMAEQSLSAQATVIPASFDAPLATPRQAPAQSALGLPCDVTVSATAMPAAIVALDVMAPCRTDAELTITHSGLQITTATDPLGLLTLDLPAFETPAFFTVTFADGVEDSVLVALPDLRDYDRIGLNWQGDMGLELHAMEFGAAFGEQGHVWHEAPASTQAAIAGEGGFLTVLETGDSHAQVYTLPRATLRERESVQLSIDAPITPQNCTREVLARTLRSEAAGPVDVTELSFTAPSCDAVGDVLVLQNLLDDLRLASN